jgi:hypothetical protein
MYAALAFTCRRCNGYIMMDFALYLNNPSLSHLQGPGRTLMTDTSKSGMVAEPPGTLAAD